MARCVLLLCVLVVLTLCQSSPVFAWWFLDPVTVYVYNKLEGGKTLIIHCKSKDDDLGVHVLPVDGMLQWSFTNNFFHTTLFWCDIQWERSPGGDWVRGSFNIYRSHRDIDRCGTNCLWYVKEDALYSPNMDGDWEPIYLWPNVELSKTTYRSG
ncbi:hypothetical protein HHK36_006016 [Tetracentron sinense]|uniref:S-protein homolog n=1 Tax=Tetracentron sinense TaxID=13715 RepID=A0A834ZGG8_TETSI|nr:hypothetical protein HHK36_006016 [Tetracentron sinense]